MGETIRIEAGSVAMEAELNDSATARQVAAALPIRARANTWGEEIYFAIPVSAGPENAQAVVSLGDLGYWPPGKAFCIFFGPTPASHGREIRPASPVNILGRLRGDPKAWGAVRDGEAVTITRVEAPPG